ncbi:hypothetical protein EHQ23_02350 [Leptospira bourretii]|uniref:Uncharacterized protein n=1 Tax=Leptospira bourretii TaxID=2484962 RepID=A0A4R9IMI4_9LEPT|nr:hypothetical protein [Leptospira bourretii]TGK89977.1 hypothetical protein EHQ23_02350 [Leptospira bourretii]TGK92200.1 hypothetical protein EHQ26_09495 [Leptospira bourretii]
MKIAILITIISAILFYFFRNKRNNEKLVIGNLSNFDEFISKLIDSKSNDSFLIISIKDTDKFIQFKYYVEEGLEIDFPLVTNEQKQKRNLLINYCKRNKLYFKINKSSDGQHEFLDIYLKAEKKELMDTVKKIYIDIYNVNPSTEFKINGDFGN